VAESSYHLQFSPQAASSENFGYTLVLPLPQNVCSSRLLFQTNTSVPLCCSFKRAPSLKNQNRSPQFNCYLAYWEFLPYGQMKSWKYMKNAIS